MAVRRDPDVQIRPTNTPREEVVRMPVYNPLSHARVTSVIYTAVDGNDEDNEYPLGSFLNPVRPDLAADLAGEDNLIVFLDRTPEDGSVEEFTETFFPLNGQILAGGGVELNLILGGGQMVSGTPLGQPGTFFDLNTAIRAADNNTINGLNFMYFDNGIDATGSTNLAVYRSNFTGFYNAVKIWGDDDDDDDVGWRGCPASRCRSASPATGCRSGCSLLAGPGRRASSWRWPRRSKRAPASPHAPRSGGEAMWCDRADLTIFPLGQGNCGVHFIRPDPLFGRRNGSSTPRSAGPPRSCRQRSSPSWRSWTPPAGTMTTPAFTPCPACTRSECRTRR
jgi:hypothetical protein